MARVLGIRRFEPQEWRVYRDLRLRALTDAPDAFGSTLALEADHSDGEWTERLRAGCATRWNEPVLAEVAGTPVGLAWGRIEPARDERAELFQMWVDPGSRGSGAGRGLLEAVVVWARASGARELALCVTCGNTPARRLYSRAGFVPVGEPEPLRPGSALQMQSMQLVL